MLGVKVDLGRKRRGSFGSAITITTAENPHPVVNELECKACGRCVVACPRQVLVMSEEINARGYHFVKYIGEGCTGCGNCFYTCPEPMALEVHVPQKKK